MTELYLGHNCTRLRWNYEFAKIVVTAAEVTAFLSWAKKQV